jgi:hypothetical protein
MAGRYVGISVALTLGVVLITRAALSQVNMLSAQEKKEAAAQTAMAFKILGRISTLKPGCTRADLFSVLTTEGGLSTWSHRIYVYRTCPYIKVDIDFRRTDNPVSKITATNDDRGEAMTDVVTHISKPYLDSPIYD